MKKALILMTCLFVTLLLSVIVHASSASAKSGATPKFVNLGTVDGKSYYADSTYRTWAEAKSNCSDLGMELATIRTVNQWNFLDRASETTAFRLYYWTGARDASNPSQFRWDDREDSIGNVINWKLHPALFRTCVIYAALEGIGVDYMTQEHCGASYKTLCEKAN